MTCSGAATPELLQMQLDAVPPDTRTAGRELEGPPPPAVAEWGRQAPAGGHSKRPITTHGTRSS
jgi:hypothetical protein